MSLSHVLLLLVAGLAAGMINSVASGGSFFTYPAMLLVGLDPLAAATTTLAALTPGNLAAIPEYWPEVKSNRARYPEVLVTVTIGGLVGIALLLLTGADVFDGLVPWLILVATGLFAASPYIRDWAEKSSPALADGRLGTVLLFVLAVYLTYFGSGVGHVVLGLLTVRGFGDFLSANAGKNIVMTLGTLMASVSYTIAGLVSWTHALPVLVGSGIGAWVGARGARKVPVTALRVVVIASGLIVAAWQFLR